MKKIFIDLTYGNLLVKLEKLNEIGIDEIITISSFLPDNLIKKIKSNPKDIKELEEIAKEICRLLRKMIRKKDVIVYLNLPIKVDLPQSDNHALMFIFYKYLHKYFSCSKNLKILFSYIVRGSMRFEREEKIIEYINGNFFKGFQEIELQGGD